MAKKFTAAALSCALMLPLLTACRPQDQAGTVNIDDKKPEAVLLSMFVPVGADLGGVDSFRAQVIAEIKKHI